MGFGHVGAALLSVHVHSLKVTRSLEAARTVPETPGAMTQP
jgi:hypothetical protein